MTLTRKSTAALIVAGFTGLNIAQAAAATALDANSGKALYADHCAACHAAGPGHPGAQSLQLKYDGKLPAVLTQRTDLAPAVVKYFVRHGAGSMPFFRKTEVSDGELDKIAAYLSSNPAPN